MFTDDETPWVLGHAAHLHSGVGCGDHRRHLGGRKGVVRLGNRHAGIHLIRARWGMPARLTLYARLDPFAGPGNIPWRHYRSFELRPPVRLRLYWSMTCDASVAWTGRDRELAWVEIEWGVGWRRRVRTVWTRPCYRSPVSVRPESIISRQSL